MNMKTTEDWNEFIVYLMVGSQLQQFGMFCFDFIHILSVNRVLFGKE